MTEANENRRLLLCFLPMTFGWAHVLNHRVALDLDVLDELCAAAGLSGWSGLEDAYAGSRFKLLVLGRDAAALSLERNGEEAALGRALGQFGTEGTLARSLLTPLTTPRPLRHARILVTAEAICDADAGLALH